MGHFEEEGHRVLFPTSFFSCSRNKVASEISNE
jgi:hypothetical protein